MNEPLRRATPHEPAHGPTPARAPVADEPFDDAPLPTRVPGQHLSHHPTVAGDDDVSDADPLRPYRVHELLTRHAHGKRRGRAEHDDDVPEAPGSAARRRRPNRNRQTGTRRMSDDRNSARKRATSTGWSRTSSSACPACRKRPSCRPTASSSRSPTASTAAPATGSPRCRPASSASPRVDRRRSAAGACTRSSSRWTWRCSS